MKQLPKKCRNKKETKDEFKSDDLTIDKKIQSNKLSTGFSKTENYSNKSDVFNKNLLRLETLLLIAYENQKIPECLSIIKEINHTVHKMNDNSSDDNFEITIKLPEKMN